MSDPEPNLPPDPAPSPSRGSLLRAAREQAHLTVAEVAARLRLSPAQVDALERDDLAALPPATFVRGFVRNYARLLDLPVAHFEAGHDAAPGTAAAQPAARLTPPPPAAPIPLETGRHSANRRWLGAAAGALVLGLVAGALRSEHLEGARTLVADGIESTWQSLQRLLPGAPAAAPTSATAVTPPAAAVSVPVPAQPVPAAAPALAGTASGDATVPVADATAQTAAPGTAVAPPAVTPAATPAAAVPPVSGAPAAELAFTFAGDSWVEVRDSRDTVLFSGTAHAGEAQTVPFSGAVRLIIGNAGATRLSLNGRDVDLAPHTRVSVARLTLDPAGSRP